MNTDQTQQSEQNREDLSQEAEATYEAPVQAGEPSEAEQQSGAEGGDQAALEQARKQAEENQQRLLRVQADFDNFRRRTREEKEQFAKYASLKLIEGLLPIIDNFERALASSKEAKDFDALYKGLDMTFRQLGQVLEQEGLKPMEPVGQPFNPEFHQAIMQVESDEHEEGIVVEQVQKGYILKDKVVRPAMVKVSQ